MVSFGHVLDKIIAFLGTFLTLDFLCHSRLELLVNHSHVLVDVGELFTTNKTHVLHFQVNTLDMVTEMRLFTRGKVTGFTFQFLDTGLLNICCSRR